MIVCHSHRFIFVTTRKTAGTAIETELARVCSATDTVTRMANGGVEASHNDAVALARYRPIDWLKLMTFGQRARLDKHLPAAAIREFVGVDVWNGYFKFCIERDPWDKAVAHYRARVSRGGTVPPIAEFLNAMKPATLSNFDLYTIDGALAVDRVIRFEHLDAELDAVGHLLDLPIELRLPPDDDRAGELRYAAKLGRAGRAVVDAVCRREIEMFGYAFRETTPEER
jgi:hypothetical protein